MAYLNPLYNGRVGVYRTNEIERFGINEYMFPNSVLKLSTTGMSNVNGLTNSNLLTSYWETRIHSTNAPFYSPAIAPFDTSGVYGVTSSVNIRTYGNDLTSNILGSRWLMNGGTGQFSVETPAFAIDSPVHIFGFEYLSSPKTYIKIESDSVGLFLISWIVNDIVSKTASGVDFTPGTRIPNQRFKILWDKTTKVSYIYGGGYGLNNKKYDTLLGTYSINTNLNPFYLMSYTVNGAYVYGTQAFAYSGGSASDLIISNYQIDGLTGSNIDGTTLPDSGQMMTQGYRY